MKVLVVGAGITGATMAERFASAGHDVIVFESREHVGGNCYDEKRNGIWVHPYGPHIFHTDNERVWEYCNRFTKFNDYK